MQDKPEPKRDDLDAEFEQAPATPKKFSLASLTSLTTTDAAARKKLKTGAFLAFLVLAMVWLLFKPEPAPQPVKEVGREPNSAAVTPAQVENYAADIQHRIAAQEDKLAGAMQAPQAQPASGFTPEQEALLARMNAQQPPLAYQPQAGSAPESPETELRRRQDSALHSGLMAISDQPQAPAAESHPAVANPYADPLAWLALQQAQQAVPKSVTAPNPSTTDEKSPQAAQNRQQQDDNSYASYTGKLFRLPEDTILEAVLVNKLNNSFSGPVIAQLATDVYSHDNQQILIPAGTRVIGEVHRVQGLGDQRLALAFHRMLMPDLYPVSLDQFQGLNQQGETGLRDKVNHHYVQIFGTSIALGAIAGLAQIGTNYGGYGVSPMTQYRAGMTESLSESAMRILDRYTTILPTFTVREGTRIRIVLTGDLVLPAYANHRLPNNL